MCFNELRLLRPNLNSPCSHFEYTESILRCPLSDRILAQLRVCSQIKNFETGPLSPEPWTSSDPVRPDQFGHESQVTFQESGIKVRFQKSIHFSDCDLIRSGSRRHRFAPANPDPSTAHREPWIMNPESGIMGPEAPSAGFARSIRPTNSRSE